MRGETGKTKRGERSRDRHGDTLTARQRSLCMSRIRSTDTSPEVAVRSMLFRMGYRFCLHRRDLPGCPDIVLPRHKKIILVHGCFWHMHRCRRGRAVPKTRRKYWSDKREGNVRRDRKCLKELRDLGWDVLVVWECWVPKAERLREHLAAFISMPAPLSGPGAASSAS